MIFCEGVRTEPEYLTAVKRLPSVRDVASVELQIESAKGETDPRHLVSMAVAARRKARNEEAEIDEFWCVFDVEWPQNHAGLRDAVAEAARNHIQVAISNPCFELWLILHFRDYSAWLDNETACKVRGELDGSSEKGLDPPRYMSLITEAMRRAALLDERHARNESLFPDNNPSSGMHRLFSSIPITSL